MHNRILLPILGALLVLLTIAGCSRTSPPQTPLAQKIARFAPTPITADVSRLTPGDREALKKLIEAAAVLDTIYLQQVWSGNLDLLRKVAADTSPEGKERFHYYMINMSPWSALDNNEPFIEGAPRERPKGANYYPEDMTTEEFTAWVGKLSAEDQAKAKGFFTVLRRDASGKLTLVPYSEEYAPLLGRAANLLREAASLTTNASLKAFLSRRADAFLSNNYVESDIAWMDLDSPIEPTIGPYEVYMDELFNYKAAFEAFITLRDEAETSKLNLFSTHLQEIENNLPIDPAYRNPSLGALAPICVVDEVATGGEARPAVQTAAFNLPNDEQITASKGSKRVLLKNVQEAKFSTCLMPISRVALANDQQPLVQFDPFFTHILAHELMHGLGPHVITVDGRKTTVRQEMKELGSALEEAKADISGLFALQYLMDHGVVAPAMERPLYATYLASVFRSIRFGIHEAHGKGTALIFNYLTDEGAFTFDSSGGTYSVNFDRIKPAVAKLTGEIMTVQARGDYAGARTLLEHYAIIRPPMQRILDKLTAVPVDIEPVFSPVN